MAFSVRNLMNNKVNEDSAYKTARLNLNKLEVSKENFYAVENIGELAESIRLCGLQQPIVCAKVGEQYKIISGHRRKVALQMLVDEGEKQFEVVPCMYKEMTESMFTIQLIVGNAFTRKLSDYELLEQVKRLKEALIEAKEKDGLEIKGKLRDYIAEMLDLSSTKVAQIDAINNRLTEEGKEEILKGQLGFSKAYELSKLPEEQQKDILENGTDKTAIEVREIAKEVAKKKQEDIQQQKKEEYDQEAESTLRDAVAKEVLGEKIPISNQCEELECDTVDDLLQELFAVSEYMTDEEVRVVNEILRKCKERQC